MDPVSPPVVPGPALPGAMPLRVLLDEAARATRTVGRRLYPTLAAFTLLSSSLILVFQVPMMRGLLEGDLTGTCAFYAAVLVMVPVSGLVYSAAGVAALDGLAGRPASIGRGLRFVLRPRRLATLVGVGILVLCAYMACFFPVLYVGPLMALVLPAMVEEGRTGMAAIERSVRLVGPNPFVDFPRNPLVRIAVFVVVAFAIYMLGSLVAQMPFEIVRQVMVLRDAAAEDPIAAMTSPPSLALQAGGVIFGSLASAAVTLYAMFCLALLFHDTRNRREGADLEAAAERIERQRAAAAGGAPA